MRPSVLCLPRHAEITLVGSASELTSCVSSILSDCTVVGLDAEWRPGSKLPALLQVGSEEKIYLIDLVALRSPDNCASVPALLTSLLSDESLVRLGWRFGGDLKVLREWLPSIELVTNYVEIADIPAAAEKRTSAGLADFVHSSLGVELSKEQQCSDWEQRPLSSEQLEYAALDVYSLLLLADSHAPSLPSPISLMPTSQTKNDVGSGGGGGGRKNSFMPNPAKSLSKASSAKRDVYIKRFCMKNEAYSNARIYSQTGALVAFCDWSKANWYLVKGLATHISGSLERGSAPELSGGSEPLTVQLLFSPEERHRGSDRGFEHLGSLEPRRNRCVVCGGVDNLSRYHLVPRSYQKYFSAGEKGHRSHDIMLTCVSHHELATRHAMQLKLKIAEEYNAPLEGVGRTAPSAEERSVVKAGSVFLRLQKRPSGAPSGIPMERLLSLEDTVRAWWMNNKPENLAHLDALDAAALEYSNRLGRTVPKNGGWQAVAARVDDGFRSHGQIVVDQLTTQGLDALHRFVLRWRVNFCRSLAPRFLPEDFRLEYRLALMSTEIGGPVSVANAKVREAELPRFELQSLCK